MVASAVHDRQVLTDVYQTHLTDLGCAAGPLECSQPELKPRADPHMLCVDEDSGATVTRERCMS